MGWGSDIVVVIVLLDMVMRGDGRGKMWELFGGIKCCLCLCGVVIWLIERKRNSADLVVATTTHCCGNVQIFEYG